MTIRPATRSEVPALEQLIAASVRGLSVGYYSPEQIESALVHVFGDNSNPLSLIPFVGLIVLLYLTGREKILRSRVHDD